METLDLFLNNYKELIISWYKNLKTKYDLEVKNLKEEYLKKGIPTHRATTDIGWNYANKYGKTSLILCGLDTYHLNNKVDKMIKAKKENFISKVEKKGGKILDCKFLKIGLDGEINGFIECENKKVDVQTITAGGYNIQCFHFRLLVK